MTLLEYTREDKEVMRQALEYAIEEEVLFEDQRPIALELLEFFKAD